MQREDFMKRWHKKDRYSKNLKEAEEIKKKWQEYTGESLRKKKKKALMTQITTVV